VGWLGKDAGIAIQLSKSALSLNEGRKKYPSINGSNLRD